MTRFFRDAAKNPVSVVLLLAMVALMAFLIVGDIINMRDADTHYMYCENLCYLVKNISICYFACIVFLMAYLTYINKQYSKWIIRLFYVLGVSSLLYFAIAGQVFDYVFHHVEANYAATDKAEREIGFKAKYTVEDSCRDSNHWQQMNPNGYED